MAKPFVIIAIVNLKMKNGRRLSWGVSTAIQMCLKEAKGGLIVDGIEIRPKPNC
ncbi:hypothetical protein GLYMA_19G231100v4 [Glycine max]|uniref:Uncharacterized protein n=2 Tax=Glycine subgen. Soja TaxID=1462606 RepID=K7MZV4_SOYBN|nr:hypothetical protein JHK87_054380 [Glycine soja]KAG4928794.1 hypothetical protein JHK85_055280 [Glycine max]KAH1079188.1 hypothetical protein GYH30_053973 [Glycine max]KRG96763.1 hypothetical protein GLYMA_19G231100v4 [Glycine max]RZB49343.1 hypothetical protein D0Y65_052343 [Glycine soja]